MRVKIIESVDSLPKKQEDSTNIIEKTANELDIPLNIID